MKIIDNIIWFSEEEVKERCNMFLKTCYNHKVNNKIKRTLYYYQIRKYLLKHFEMIK